MVEVAHAQFRSAREVRRLLDATANVSVQHGYDSPECLALRAEVEAARERLARALIPWIAWRRAQRFEDLRQPCAWRWAEPHVEA